MSQGEFNFSYNDFYIIPSLIYKTNKLVIIDDCLYNYVYRDNSLSHTRKFNGDEYVACLNHVYDKIYDLYPDATICFYVNQLLLFHYAKEIRYGLKYDYKKLNKILKEKTPKYYKNKYFNKNIYMKIYIRLMYYDRIFLVKLITFIKFKIIDKIQ